ncbi:Alpha/Beta hydrolase protein [Lactarius psammicola]|nr:Alpha/Beta hydrolase protein [Lactarius psammicola]
MPHRTVPRPMQPPRTDEGVVPNLLFPLQEPPQSLKYPALPCPPRDHRFTSTYTVTTHLIPAAFPRVSPFAPLPPVPGHESKDERGARVERYASEFIAQQTQHAPDKSESQPTVLWTVLNRYARADTSSETGLTLLLLHANGLHKETFEPTLRHLFEAVDNDKRYRIDEVWALDAVQHGDSGLVNAQNLGSLFIWNDHARDILNFILHFLPEEATPSALSTYLPRVPPEASEARKRLGFASRKLVVVGHSLGGCTAVLAAYSTPAPFSGLILLDPVIRPAGVVGSQRIREYVIGALSRRSVWRTREEAYSLLSKSPFFGSWDPDVLRNYVEHALVEDASGQVRLKCTNFQEAVVFADGTRCLEAWSALPHIDERIPVKWLVPPAETSVMGSYEMMQKIVWGRPENASNSLISTATHLMVQDSPREVAQELHEFLLKCTVGLRSNL